jgi:hypothetical protein
LVKPFPRLVLCTFDLVPDFRWMTWWLCPLSAKYITKLFFLGLCSFIDGTLQAKYVTCLASFTVMNCTTQAMPEYELFETLQVRDWKLDGASMMTGRSLWYVDLQHGYGIGASFLQPPVRPSSTPTIL